MAGTLLMKNLEDTIKLICSWNNGENNRYQKKLEYSLSSSYYMVDIG